MKQDCMHLGFVSAILPDRTLGQVFQTAADIGYECVELMCWPPSAADRRYAGVTHVDVGEFSVADADRVRSLAAAAGVGISGLGYYPNPLSPQATEAATAVAHIGKVIRAAAMLGVHKVNTFVGRDWTRSVDDNWPRFLEVWRPLVRLAEEHHVSIGIENCPMLFSRDEWPGGKNLATSPAIWRRMFTDIPSFRFGLNYDPSHLVWQQMDCVQPLVEFAERIHHVHAKDARLDRDRLDAVGILAAPLEYHAPVLPGLGDVPWGRFFATLSRIGYRGPVCVEVEDRAYEDSLAGRHAALVQSHTYLRNFLAARPAKART
jgi:sugar phosphate isomerase/epimerase